MRKYIIIYYDDNKYCKMLYETEETVLADIDFVFSRITGFNVIAAIDCTNVTFDLDVKVQGVDS